MALIIKQNEQRERTEWKYFSGKLQVKCVGLNPQTKEEAQAMTGSEYVPSYHGTTKDGVDWSKLDYWMECTQEGPHKGKRFCLTFFLMDQPDEVKSTGKFFTMDSKGNSLYLDEAGLEEHKKNGEKLRKAYKGEKDWKAFLKTICNLKKDDDCTVNTKMVIGDNFTEVLDDAKLIVDSNNEIIIFVGLRKRTYEKDGETKTTFDTDVYTQVKPTWSKSDYVEKGIEKYREKALAGGRYYATNPYDEVDMKDIFGEEEKKEEASAPEAPAQVESPKVEPVKPQDDPDALPF